MSSSFAELYAPTTGIAKSVVTRHILKELGHEVTLMNHVDNLRKHGHANEASTEETCNAEVHVGT